MRSLLARLHDTFKRQALDRELDDEIATHLELATAEMQARGMNREEARRAALKGFGGLFQVKEAEREVRSFPGLETIWVVSRDAVRLLWKQPRFAAVAIFTLALGIGATTAVYSVVNGVLLKPLPFRDPDRLVALYHVTPASEKDIQGAATYFTYRDHVPQDSRLPGGGGYTLTYKDVKPESLECSTTSRRSLIALAAPPTNSTVSTSA